MFFFSFFDRVKLLSLELYLFRFALLFVLWHSFVVINTNLAVVFIFIDFTNCCLNRYTWLVFHRIWIEHKAKGFRKSFHYKSLAIRHVLMTNLRCFVSLTIQNRIVLILSWKIRVNGYIWVETFTLQIIGIVVYAAPWLLFNDYFMVKLFEQVHSMSSM